MKYIKKQITDILNKYPTYANKYSNIYSVIFNDRSLKSQDDYYNANYISVDLFLNDLNSVCIEYNYIISGIYISIDNTKPKGERCYANLRVQKLDKKSDPIEYEDVAEYHADHFKYELSNKSEEYKNKYNISKSCPVYRVVFKEYLKKYDSVNMIIYFEIW